MVKSTTGNTPIAKLLTVGTVVTLVILLLSVIIVNTFFAGFLEDLLGIGIGGQLTTIGQWSLALASVLAVAIILAGLVGVILREVL